MSVFHTKNVRRESWGPSRVGLIPENPGIGLIDSDSEFWEAVVDSGVDSINNESGLSKNRIQTNKNKQNTFVSTFFLPNPAPA